MFGNAQFIDIHVFLFVNIPVFLFVNIKRPTPMCHYTCIYMNPIDDTFYYMLIFV